jgi:hypothetical protein
MMILMTTDTYTPCAALGSKDMMNEIAENETEK